MHPNFDPPNVQTHDFQIMDSAYHVPGTLAPTLSHKESLPQNKSEKKSLSNFPLPLSHIHLRTPMMCTTHLCKKQKAVLIVLFWTMKDGNSVNEQHKW